MPFQFSNPSAYAYSPGSLFLGVNDDGREIGMKTERHAITVAGSRTGKGAGLIVPNLLRWPHSALVVDTKGDNAALTWKARRDMGQAVYVLDPFREADVPDIRRASYNPLADLDPRSPTIREDITVIADGLVLRHKAEDGEWYDGGVAILAGFIAHALTAFPPELHRLAIIRDMLNASGDNWAVLLAGMAENPACGGLAQTAAALLADGSKSAREFHGTARRSIDKFGSDALQACMAESSFRLSDLKAGRCTVFLVLPSRYVEEHARFFRLFVRLALNEMEKPTANKSGPDRFKGTPCLFILDEFFSLGKIDAVQKAAGRMAGNGVHLWPFVQDLGQLTTLYGQAGMETFFGNSDARIFFGNTDPLTLTNISGWLDRITPEEIASAPPEIPPFHVWRDRQGLRGMIWNDQEARDAYQAAMENDRARHGHAMGMSGRARLSPPEIAALVAKKPGDLVARSMIVFGPGNDVLNLRLAPYFLPPPKTLQDGEEYPGQATDAAYADLANAAPLRAYLRRERARARDNLIMRAESAPLWQWVTWLAGTPIGAWAWWEILRTPNGEPAPFLFWFISSIIFAMMFCPVTIPLTNDTRRTHALNRMRAKYGLPPVESAAKSRG
ncbi:type IV secretory system conjugative DNA transfer family protein [Siccirubricoccus phaeus]|uniref:type IV secretory system conjugative DNA transfer family protein n=1 Tax=Siccirubricoccus phaeus TaxID=2595053 RepID=UPI0011F2C30A|nr:type IV secretory system conjugative DNA transfer family protein [Siccirubricoccus phaeus]